jgi:predicted RNase H-like HicB family nuclease
MTGDSAPHTFPVGLEEGPDGAVLVHGLSVPGCVAAGLDRDEALAAFPDALAEWLHFLAGHGEPIPEPESELEIAVDEWVASTSDVAGGESTAFFDADRPPLTRAEIDAGLRRLGDLRGTLLRRLRQLPPTELEKVGAGEWSARRIADELARAQWWTLTRLGASPLAEVPERTVGRLDTAMALVVQRFTELGEIPTEPVEIDGELWTPRKVLRRLLWIEWTLGGSLLHLLTPTAEPA